MNAMADNDIPAYVPPPLPDSNSIPRQLVEQWLQIPPSAYLEIRLTRNDWDHIFACLNASADAQVHLQTSLIYYSQGNLSAANKGLYEAQRSIILSQNALRNFFTAVMSAAKGPSHG
jgi:hypothetical protein